MKKVLVLYPGLAGLRHTYLARYKWKLRLAGIRLSLADEVIEHGDTEAFDETLLLPAPEEFESAWNALRRFLDTHRVDAIVAQSEPALLIGAKACEHLGLPGPSVEAALRTTDKFLCRELLAEAGVPQPRFTIANCAEDVRRFAGGQSVILKAFASSRQRLVTPIAFDANGEAPGDLEAAVAQMLELLPESKDIQRLIAFARFDGRTLERDPRRAFLVESLEPGRPVECDGVLSGKRVHSLGICEQMMTESPALFIEGYLHPANLSPPAARNLEVLTRRALEALGLEDSGYSVEYRVTGDRATLIEVNGRLGWDEGLGELFESVYGQFPAALALRVALGKRLGSLIAKRHAALVYRSWYDGAVIKRVPSQAELRAASRRGLSCHLNTYPGATVLEAHDPDSRPHLLHALVTDPNSSLSAFRRGRRALNSLEIEMDPVLHPRAAQSANAANPASAPNPATGRSPAKTAALLR